jgi:hypothetical protein
MTTDARIALANEVADWHYERLHGDGGERRMIVVTVSRERRWTSPGAGPATASLRPIPARRNLR